MNYYVLKSFGIVLKHKPFLKNPISSKQKKKKKFFLIFWLLQFSLYLYAY